MQVTARVDYAIRALAELASMDGASGTRAQLAEAQRIPGKYLESILADLKKAGLLVSQRGSSGGYVLALPPEQIQLAHIVRAVEGPLAGVRGAPPEDTSYAGAAAPLRDIWVAVRAGLRLVLESTTLADLVSGTLPPEVTQLLSADDAWQRR